MVVAWLSGNALILINVVTLRRARLALGWVTVCEWVNHLSMSLAIWVELTQPSILCGTAK